MKNKYIFIVVALALLVFGSAPVYAAEAEQYTPIIPKFISLGNGASVNIPYNTSDSEIKAFLKDFYTNPYLIVVVQGTDTDYMPRDPNLPSSKYVGEDKQWSLNFLKPKSRNKDYTLEFTYFDKSVSNDFPSYPMDVNIMGGISPEWEVLRYDYDFASNKFRQGVIQTQSPYVKFSYVVDSSVLSKPVSKYPYYSNLGGKDFRVRERVNGGKPAHYNWWIGKKRTDPNDNEGVIKPPDSGGDDGTSSEPTSSEPTTSEPTSSDGGGSDSTYPKPGTGGDGDIDVGKPGGYNAHLTINFFYYVNGVKTPFPYSPYDVPREFDSPINARFTFVPTKITGYVPEYSVYKWMMDRDRVEEVIFYPKNSGGGSSSSGGGTSSGGGGGDGGGTDGKFIPIIPFDPNWWQNFTPKTEDPWGFDIFKDLLTPKPIEFPDKMGDVPLFGNPLDGIKIPVVDNPLLDLDKIEVAEPPMTIPTVDDPLKNQGIPNVNEPSINIPTVDDPFKDWKIPVVDNPFELSFPQLDDPLSSVSVPQVDDPFLNWKW